MNNFKTEAAQVLQRVEGVLSTAYLGLEMMRDPSGRKKDAGLRNVLVFGRSVTFVLQNLRSIESSFDDWYDPHVAKMKADPIMQYFKDARNNLEKQGRIDVKTSATINALNDETMKLMQKTKPPGAKAMFIGDQLGGSGWEVELQGGETLRYYVELSVEIGVVEQSFALPHSDKFKSLENKSTLELTEHFLGSLSEIVNDANRTFAGAGPSQSINGRRIPSFLRVVK